jgi:hypothetical protein
MIHLFKQGTGGIRRCSNFRSEKSSIIFVGIFIRQRPARPPSEVRSRADQRTVKVLPFQI